MMMMNIYSCNLLAKAIFSRDLVQYRKKYDDENYKNYIKLLSTFVVNSKKYVNI